MSHKQMLYDQQMSAFIGKDYLPEDIREEEVVAFLRAHGCAFYSLSTLVDGVWGVRHDMFRIATSDFPSRGVNTSFTKLREWRTELKKAELVEGRALCTELPQIVVRLRAAGLYRTARLMDDAVKSIGFELADLIEARKATDMAA